ncbi:hypothetical protein [Xanthomonas sp. A1809]|nr:hypothetical protein [Xanthomonas sp. A1809]MBO9855106.1 hypothetical protein [Xanthomonas sp. A1809]
MTAPLVLTQLQTVGVTRAPVANDGYRPYGGTRVDVLGPHLTQEDWHGA